MAYRMTRAEFSEGLLTDYILTKQKVIEYRSAQKLRTFTYPEVGVHVQQQHNVVDLRTRGSRRNKM